MPRAAKTRIRELEQELDFYRYAAERAVDDLATILAHFRQRDPHGLAAALRRVDEQFPDSNRKAVH